MHKIPFVLSLGAVVALGACTDPGTLGGNPENKNANQGALIGAGTGAVIGALISDDRGRGAVIGAALGGAAGAGIGYSLDRQEAELRRDLGNDRVTITNTGDRLIVSFPQDILFAVNSFAVRPDLQSDLGVLASSLGDYPNSTVQIVGHTDSDGEAAFNQQLSERRANAVADVLLNNGVPFNRVQTFGRGESQPIASNLTPEGKAQNRRVEIVILPNA
ncbi:OmpA family protein [Tateyamaria sp. SN6-1]|uniref:OmpA family protein n=1 Tax=Tateyamaria sp. SN6-1 TaxID=3092148 RepID=UPI0039F55CBB